MVAFEQYPDTLTIVGTDKVVECRVVPYRDTRMYKRQDGNEIVPSFKIAFPIEVGVLPIGTIVTANDMSGEYIHGMYEQEILAFHQGQLHNVGTV